MKEGNTAILIFVIMLVVIALIAAGLIQVSVLDPGSLQNVTLTINLTT